MSIAKTHCFEIRLKTHATVSEEQVKGILFQKLAPYYCEVEISSFPEASQPEEDIPEDSEARWTTTEESEARWTTTEESLVGQLGFKFAIGDIVQHVTTMEGFHPDGFKPNAFVVVERVARMNTGGIQLCYILGGGDTSGYAKVTEEEITLFKPTRKESWKEVAEYAERALAAIKEVNEMHKKG